ncbi:hypothetical protein [Pseudomonas asgharzadehiana]|uniref:Uncharacterized protein n=1 Tax=Pseudomonas asgharzadehiana TaxID=2842349 RepID=A0ABX8P3W9_9PSED|nr:hypothetical protein [Pseudomonas asgharzadehiana]QXH68579.1 hypothetical protein KSS96_06490 [Pseudomonas asgharzadehiana]
MNNSVYETFSLGWIEEQATPDLGGAVYIENRSLAEKHCLSEGGRSPNITNVREELCTKYSSATYHMSLTTKYSALLSSVDLTLGNHKKAQELLYHWEGNQHGRIASVFAVFFIERNYAAMNLEAINSLMLTTSVKRLTEWSMVAMLRASFSAKQSLPAWEVFYKQVKLQLKDNPRISRLLAGLDD